MPSSPDVSSSRPVVADQDGRSCKSPWPGSAPRHQPPAGCCSRGPPPSPRAASPLAELLHDSVSWELSVALAPCAAQGAFLGVHGLAQSAQRSIGPLAVTAAIATGPAGWTAFGALIALTCVIQHRLVRDRLARTPLSVLPVTVSEH
ncbi:hypothetical protein [Streptomyces sp. NPDC006668]|uniref:hypothetical protein n=1 Tax=Streptomyces sp. NPDC006668 TaxID=3156903 RepID=UPI0033F51855